MPDTTVRLAPAQAAEWEIAVKAILCDCGCHPQSIKDCACGRAAEMRDEVATMIAQGPSGDQVIAKLVAERGEKILVVPAASGFNLLAWLGPLAALFLLAAAMAVVLHRWRSKSPPALEPAPSGPAVDDPYAARLAREMREYDR